MVCSNVSDRGGRRCPTSRDDAAGQIWGLYRSGKQTQPDPVTRDDVAAQIWGLYRSGKQTTPDPALRPPSRHKSTKSLFHSATNSSPASHLKDRPPPPPSTLTPAPPPPSPARRSMPPNMTPANPSCLTPPSTRIPFAPPPPSPARRLEPSFCFWWLETLGPSEPAFSPVKTTTTNGKTLIWLEVSFNGLGPHNHQKHQSPTNAFLRSILKSCGPTSKGLKPIYMIINKVHQPCVHRFVTLIIQSNPTFYVSYSVLVGRRLHPSRVVSYLVWLACYQSRGLMVILAQAPSKGSSLLQNCDRVFLETFVRRLQMKQDNPLLLWLIKTSLRTPPLAPPRIGYHLEVDWKQVDSKKILAQPHQSATHQPPIHLAGTTDDSLTLAIVFTAIVSRNPPLHLIGLIEDILILAKRFRDLYFSFFPRSQNTMIDDLAKKAARSMTIGPPISMYYSVSF